jgi:hypothetical protein
LPDDYLSKQAELLAAVATSVRSLVEHFASKKQQDAKSAESKTGTADAFLMALLLQIEKDLNAGKLPGDAFFRKARGVIYAHGLLPVIRSEMTDRVAFDAYLAQIEERSGYKIPWEKCGELDCLSWGNPEHFDPFVQVVVHPDHIAAGFTVAGNAKPFTDHLTGKAPVPAPYSLDELKRFIEKNGYTGYGEGFIKLREASDVLLPVMTGMIAQQKGREDELEMMKNCALVANRVLDNMPMIVTGTRELSGTVMHLESVIDMSPELASVMQELPAPIGELPVMESPVIAMGVSLDIPRLRDRLLELIGWLVEQGKATGCTILDEQQLNEASVQIAMVTGMGLSQIKTVYFALDRMELDPKDGSLVSMDARGAIVASDPAGLVRMAAIAVPELASIEIPTDGETISIGREMLPPEVPPVTLGLVGKRIDLVTQGSQAATTLLQTDKPLLLWSRYDYVRYFEMFEAEVGKKRPEGEGNDEDFDMIFKLIEEFNALLSKSTDLVYPDSRGLVYEMKMTYPE